MEVKSSRRDWINVILILLGLFVLFLLFRQVNWRELWANLYHVDLFWLCLALLATAANVWAKAMRWGKMTWHAAGVDLGHSAIPLILAGVATSSLAPGRAVDTGKPLLMKRLYGLSFGTSGAGVVIERFMDLWSLIVVLLASLFFIRIPSAILHSLLFGSFLAFFLITVLLIWPLAAANIFRVVVLPLVPFRFRNRADGLFGSITASLAVWRKSSVGLGLLGWSLAAVLGEVLRTYFVMRAFTLGVGMGATSFAWSAGAFVGLMAVIPGGLGITEASQAFFLRSVANESLPVNAIAAGVLIDRILSTYLLTLLGAWVLIWSGKKTKGEHAF